jgi:nicotinamide-nucleotide amidase
MLKKLMQSHPSLRLAVAESLTGGNVQSRITAESGASEFFVGGVTAYTLDQKVALLGVDRGVAELCNSVSAEVSRQMAQGVCVLMKCNLGISTTGYAEVDRFMGIVAPRAHWTVCHVRDDGETVFVDGFAEFPGADRVTAQTRATDAVLGALAMYLESLSGK